MDRQLFERILRTSTDEEFLGTCFQVSAIKDELRKRRLDVDGNKEEMIRRLVAANVMLAADSNENTRRNDESAFGVPLGSWSESETEVNLRSGDPLNVNVGRTGDARRIRRGVGYGLNATGRLQRNEVRRQSESDGIQVTLHTTPDLSGTIQEYGGKRWESLKRWFESLDNAKRQCNWSDAVVRGVAISRLRGEAQCWQTYEGSDYTNWKEWKAAIRAAFEKPLTLREWNEMVTARKQKHSETLAEYFGEKMSLIKRAPDQFTVGLEAAIDYLISGVLEGNIRKVLRLREYSSIHELIQIARTLDRDDEKQRTEQKASNCEKLDRKQTTKREVQWNARDTEQSSAAKYTSSKPKRRDDIVCYRCNEKGHISTECPQRRQTIQRTAERMVTNCIMTTKWPSKGITVVDATAFGKQYDVMVDSGCERTVVRKSAVPKEFTIDAADGQKLKVVENEVSVLGTVKVAIEINGFKGSVTAAVVERSPFEVIVGSDWRQNANVAITTFPDASIEIKKCETNATMVGVFLFSDNKTLQSTKCQNQKTIDTDFEREIKTVLTGVTSDATSDEKLRLEMLLRKHKKVFATVNEDLGCCTDMECAIRLKDDVPVCQKPVCHYRTERLLTRR
ncbi:blastopia polyprotein-like protein [Leptotrombidium deliense]|uniref:Blastopia polyprotein-like protein n=1 Tax=Leptotrombidium deliense TaxID=299467 RepID=A0A443S1H3_9ACAR|nr:blastopia polyprotein-like protein [Leptotrombidium deliense]